MSELTGKTIVVLIEEFYNGHEFWYPKFRLLEAGATVIVAGTKAGAEYKSKIGLPVKADVAFTDLDPAACDGVIIPGGYAPDYMRRSEACLAFVKSLNDQKKLVAFICHAGWVAASAGILAGRKATSVAAIKTDMVNAGAQWLDAEVVRDANMISSRTPADLPAFMKAVVGFYHHG